MDDAAAMPHKLISHPIAPERLRLIRSITFAVVAGPWLGSALLVASWALAGVRTASLVALAIGYALGTLSVTIGFHRYFAHRAFTASRPVAIAFVILGSMSAQGPLLYWVATHRRHHQFSDTVDDPHSPHFRGGGPCHGAAGAWHSHIGWMFDDAATNALRFAPDILRDRTIFTLQSRYGLWILVGLLVPPLATLPFTRDPTTLLQVFLAAGPLRLALVHQASWAVGSLCHMRGARPFDTGDRSANNFWVALVAFGEGLQNNHHAFPRSAAHGLRWFEPDLTWLVLRGLAAVGLIGNLHRPSRSLVASRRRPRTVGERR